MNFAEVLKEFKSIESADSIAPIVDSQELRNGILAWKSVSVKIIKNETCFGKGDVERWDWLWDCVSFDISRFGVVSGVRSQDARNLFERLRGYRLIYPDGTVNSFAIKYLQAVIMSKLPRTKAKGEPR